MKDIRQIHNQAIDLVRKANIALESNDRMNYLMIIEKAYILEQEAAMELALSVETEPTRSVLFRSAANLAFLCGKYEEANRLIYFALTGNPFKELVEELLELQSKILPYLGTIATENEITENVYLEFLKQKSVNIKVEPKVRKFSKAVVISHIVDFLKNIQQSYLNFSDVRFLKFFEVDDFQNFEIIHKNFIQETQLLGVDLKFSSFGISIVADTGTMAYNWTTSDKFKEFRTNLFPSFIEDVLLPDHNSIEYKAEICKKYNEEERKKIFSPIISSLSDSSPYQVSLANKDFTKQVKTFKALSKETKTILSPPIEQTFTEISLIRKTEQKTGQKSKTIIIEQLKNAEFQVDLKDIYYENKKVYFTDPYSIFIIFSENHYTITDDYYDIFVRSHDYTKILHEYYKTFIQKYEALLKDKNSLNQTDIEILERFERTAMRDW